MIGRTNAGGGGGALNFKIASAAAAPVSPPENTIWVTTAAAITGWQMSASTPSNPTEGLLWLQTGDSGAALNALIKNAILVALKAAKLYAGGKWENLDGAIWQNGKWVDFSTATLILYDAGDQCEAVTGGWASTGYTAGGYQLAGSTVGDSYLQVTGATSGSSPKYSIIGTQKMVNLDNVSKIRAQINITNQGIVRVAAGTSQNVTALGTYTQQTGVGTYEFELDVSGLSGDNYIVIFATGSYAAGTNPTARITKVWAE